MNSGSVAGVPRTAPDVPAEFRVLGPVGVACGGAPVRLSAGRTQTVLAMLLLEAGRAVSFPRLVAALWEDDPPNTARSQVQICVSALRRLLTGTGAAILTEPPGYLLRIPDGSLDLWRFRELCVTAESLAGQRADEAAVHYREALALWRGDACASVASHVVGQAAIQLNEERWTALERRMALELQLGRHQQVVAELAQIVAAEPFRQPPRAPLMLALYRGGRRADALEAYRSGRRLLTEEIGTDPGRELQALEQAILTGAPSLDVQAQVPPEVPAPELRQPHAELLPAAAPAAPAAPAGPLLPRPAQLPADIADFTGRGTHVDYLRETLTRPDLAGGPGAVRIAVVAGTAGIGKTTLAVHVAHQVRHLFPDGQLYADLSGASAEPASPGEVLARFLRDLGVDGGKIPVGDEERAALYRTRLTGRRGLVVPDHAKDAAQVRSLLPGSASCAVLVTTRNRAPYLVSAGFVDLTTLSEREAAELFSQIVGGARPAAEPEATAEILGACAGLPLAIRICAGRPARRGQWRIATMAARLRDERPRLDELQVGDLEVRASFRVSYDNLRAGRHRVDPAHAFRLLGLGPGQRISLNAAAALIGEPEADAADALETLVDANLLESPEPDWYQLHDLLRLFATERAQAEEPEEARHSAVDRLLQWYLAMAETAADVISPQRYRMSPGEPHTQGLLLDSVEAALTWYDGERAGVIAAIRQAAAAGRHDIAWQLAVALFALFDRRDNWADCITAHRIAIESARAAAQRQAEAWTAQNLGQALVLVSEEEAFFYLEEALAIRREVSDRDGEAQTAISLAFAYNMLRGPEAAIDHSLRSLEILRRCGNRVLLGIGLTNHADYCLALGRLDEAAECSREALGIWTPLEKYGRGYATENLGRVYLESDRLSEAIASLNEAYRLHLADGALRAQAAALKYLAEAQRRAGYADQARESLTEAVALFKKLNADAEVAAAQAALAALA